MSFYLQMIGYMAAMAALFYFGHRWDKQRKWEKENPELAKQADEEMSAAIIGAFAGSLAKNNDEQPKRHHTPIMAYSALTATGNLSLWQESFRASTLAQAMSTAKRTLNRPGVAALRIVEIKDGVENGTVWSA